MTDVFSRAKRSEVMSRIQGVDTWPELVVRRLLHRDGFRFALHRKDLPGRPDIVLPKYRAVVFVHGCFWHGHSCKWAKQPGTNAQFWCTKLAANRMRDRRDRQQLRRLGWRVFTIWECRLRRDGESTVRRLENRIRRAL